MATAHPRHQIRIQTTPPDGWIAPRDSGAGFPVLTLTQATTRLQGTSTTQSVRLVRINLIRARVHVTSRRLGT